MVRSRGRLQGAFLSVLLAVITIALAGEAPTRSDVSGVFDGPHRSVWVGEVFDLSLTWRASRTAFRNLDGPLEWTADPLVAEPWQKPTLEEERSVSAEPLAAVKFRTRALALKPGFVSLSSARQTLVLETGVVRTGDYDRVVTEPVQARSQGAAVVVRPLPPAPQGFLGAVGKYALSASVDGTQASVGRAMTWTLTLSGVGNWPYLEGWPTREISRDFDVMGAPRVSEMPGSALFERTARERLVLIPRRVGRYSLGPVEMWSFDPDRGEYMRLTASAITVDVQPSEAATGGNTVSGSPAAKPILPALLSGKGSATLPMTDSVWRLGLIAPPIAVALVWVLLACLHALESDPERESRLAHARLKITLRRIAHTGDAEQRRFLTRSWQRDVGMRRKLDHAAPVPASFSEHDPCRQLWADVDAFLYGRAGALPEDWSQRAYEAWREQGPPPRFAVTRVLRLRNFYPSMCLVGLAMMCWVPSAIATTPYTAEKSWREAVTRDPLDWKAHYNLAVTLAAREHWDEAAGHAGVAWLQQSQAQATRELWLRAAREAGYAPAAAGGVPQPLAWPVRIAALSSPATWRLIVMTLVALSAVGGMLLVFVRYGRAKKQLQRLALALFLGAAVAAISAYALLNVYGVLIERDAVLVWRSTPLRPLPVDTLPNTVRDGWAAGTAGRADRHFLDWWRVRCADGRIGWIREEDLVWVWGPRQEHK